MLYVAFYFTRFDKNGEIIQQGMMPERDPDDAYKALDDKRLNPGDKLIGTMVTYDGKSVTFYDGVL